MDEEIKINEYMTPREKFLALSLQSTRKSYYPQLQRQLESAEKTARQLRLITDHMPACIYYMDADLRYRFINRSCEESLGWYGSEVLGRYMKDVIGEENFLKKEPYIRKVLSGNRVRFEVIFEGSARQGWWSISYVPDHDAHGAVIGFYGLAQDLTKRKQAEEALRQSEEKYRLLVEYSNEAIFILQDGDIRFPNPKTLAVLGCSVSDLDRKPFIEFVHPEDRQSVEGFYRNILAGNSPPQFLLTFRLINCSGEQYSMQLNAVSVTWEEQPAVLNFLSDITALKNLEAHLLRTQKMEAIGKLAGGIAHDFNNMLMGIQGRVSLMMADDQVPGRFRDHLESIEGNIKSASDLTQRLLGFARGGMYEIRPADLNEIVEQSMDMFGRTRKEIRIHKKYARDLWSVEVDKRQIEQVLLNLFVNAWQAMAGGGDISLETKNVVMDVQDVAPFQVPPGRYVNVSVTDTGIGMDEQTLARAFDPFFTTKEIGRGSGLGLASAYGIVESHGGFITLHSEKGKGTTANVFLPASDKPVHEESKTRSEPVRGSGMILLVDDESMILEVGAEMLKVLGYRVCPAKGGKEATNILLEKRDEIDLVILDMVMPDLSGREAFDRIREISPNVKVLLSSGYSANGQASEILDRGCDGFIQKPFDMNSLSEKIRKILEY